MSQIDVNELAERCGDDLIPKAERYFGKRDPNWTLGAIRRNPDGDYAQLRLYPDSGYVDILLSSRLDDDDLSSVMCELAHECIRFLDPCTIEDGTYLCAGLASWFQVQVNENLRPTDGRYVTALEAVERLMPCLRDAVRDRRFRRSIPMHRIRFHHLEPFFINSTRAVCDDLRLLEMPFLIDVANKSAQCTPRSSGPGGHDGQRQGEARRGLDYRSHRHRGGGSDLDSQLENITPDLRASSGRLCAFLSFATKDKALVDAFRRKLELRHPNVELLDHAVDNRYEENWKLDCDRKIQESALLICLIGDTTHQSNPVSWEIGRGLALGKRVVAVNLMDRPLRIPELLERNSIELLSSSASFLGESTHRRT